MTANKNKLDEEHLCEHLIGMRELTTPLRHSRRPAVWTGTVYWKILWTICGRATSPTSEHRGILGYIYIHEVLQVGNSMFLEMNSMPRDILGHASARALSKRCRLAAIPSLEIQGTCGGNSSLNSSASGVDFCDEELKSDTRRTRVDAQC